MFCQANFHSLEFRYKDEARNGVAEENPEEPDQEFSAAGCFVYLA